MNLVGEGTLEIVGLGAVHEKDTGQILLRTEVDDGFYIKLINRLSGEVSSEFPSKCKHIPASLIAHPTEADFVLESCLVCKVIRNYNIKTGHCSIVYEGYTFYKMCRGPTQSELIRMCYNELYDMLVVKDEENEIKAMKLSEVTSKLSAPIWKLSGVIDGQVIEPDALTSDKMGYIYVSDGANNRILKINGSNGDVMIILLLEEANTDPLRYLFWSDIEPNLTVVHGDKISTYCIPRSD